MENQTGFCKCTRDNEKLLNCVVASNAQKYSVTALASSNHSVLSVKFIFDYIKFIFGAAAGK